MADKIRISAETRTEFGKGSSRRARRANLIPGVIYGHGDDPRHVLLPGHETSLAVRNPNALITLDIEGDTQMVVPKDIQRDPLKPFIVHMDLLAVRKGEKIVVDVPVEVIGEPAVGFEHMLDQPTVPVEADALNLPEHVDIDITDLEENALPDALILPEGAELALSDMESPIVSVYEPQEQDVEEDTEAEEAEEPAEEGAEVSAAEEGEDDSE
ncbi:50S ribosomal protein L25/general stress protein Ctc [Garicola koreensis]|uniref:Large ribosomal subunit protein bL25 n=1 Tax=Garicola koreensis TaxID=1262554 RepID=A0A7W5XJN8_9MICC|nr:50S ribosomal protein L25/general stress protein Ctc [Garicola koreensis]MBB3666542.1 large subunit ribosomal protein L25 [Garicola koreensis]